MKKNLDTILLLSALGSTAFYLFYLKPVLKERAKQKETDEAYKAIQDVIDGKKPLTEVVPNSSAVYSWENGVPCYVPPCGLQEAFSTNSVNQDFINKHFPSLAKK